MNKLVENPYLDEFNQYKMHRDHTNTPDPFRMYQSDYFDKRRQLRSKYAYAVPIESYANAILRHGVESIVEIGAGTGYWAWWLSQYGITVNAYDTEPYFNKYIEGRHAPVAIGSHTQLARHPSSALLMVWPPWKGTMASDTLKAYKGGTLLYVGEEEGGCTGDRLFHDMIYEEWELVIEVDSPNYYDIHSSQFIYQRKGA